jgi:YebC/PmpR family DNA-binding regulatory protein
MAGHSKWKNIRLQKGKADIIRGKLFGKLSREITIAAKMGGGVVDSNPRLRLAVEKARSSSMPADNIKRAIQKGTGELGGADYEEITYEGYGPGGVAVLVEAATDNRNRTVADLRHLFSKHGGNLGENGSVAWQFARTGILTIPTEGNDEDALLDAVLEAGGEDLENGGENFEVTATPDVLSDVRATLEAKGFTVTSEEVAMVAQNKIQPDAAQSAQLLKLLDAIEDHDDVQNVATNAEFDDAFLENA